MTQLNTHQAIVPTFDNIPLSSIQKSATNPRKRFCPVALQELADSITQMGVAQPILVRPHNGSADSHVQYEIVAGERRYRASVMAGTASIPCIIRDLTDGQALEIQVIENLQREDVHPLEEAEGYDRLMKLHNITADELVSKVGKSRSYIYGRLKLLELSEDSREAFYDGKLDSSTALLIARIPNAELQAEAVQDITTTARTSGEPLSYRQARDHIRSRFTLALKSAPFDTANVWLVQEAGSCAQCPKRTGNQPELFSDIEGADICTDTTCFDNKRTAHKQWQIDAAKAAGRTVFAGDAARKIKPSQWSGLEGGYINLDHKCLDDGKNRTYRQVLGDKLPETALFDNPHNDEPLIEILKRKDIEKLLKQNIIKRAEPKPAAKKMTPEQAEKQEQEKKAEEDEAKYRRTLFDQVCANIGSELNHKLLVMLADDRLTVVDDYGLIAELYDVDEGMLYHYNRKEERQEWLEDLDEDQLQQLIVYTLLMEDVAVPHRHEDNPPKILLDFADEFDINAAAIKAAIANGEEPATPGKKPAKKAAPVKKVATKKAAPKKQAAKKPAPKKATAKKPAVKKPAAKKPATKKPATKKTTTKVSLQGMTWPFPTRSK
jgi:ParB/RepB/Spo0J family partition protein